MGDKSRGLYNKFTVERTDGTSASGQKHDGCEYFVLDLTHDKFTIPALAAYIDACTVEYPRLAADLRAQLYAMKARATASTPPATPPPVDRSQRTLTDGSPVTPDHREFKPNGQQKGYVVLSAEERAKGFVRPVRRTYTHKTCGTDTTMGRALAETYARDPGFYSGTFCCHCSQHFPLDQFVWKGTDEQVGS